MDPASLAAITGLLDDFDAIVAPRQNERKGYHRYDVRHFGHNDIEVDEISLAPLPSFKENTTTDNQLDKTAYSRPSSNQNNRNTLAVERRLRYILKVKNERKTLKRQQCELSEHLSKLQQAHALIRQRGANASSNLRAWKAAATRQKERRLEAEEQRRRLQDEVAAYNELIHQLYKMLQLRTLNRPSEYLIAPTPAKGGRTALFKTFLDELDLLHAQTDDVIRSGNLKMSNLPLRFEMTRQWSQDKALFESADATVIPFEIERVNEALSSVLLANSSWKHFKDEIDRPENTTAAIYRLDHSKILGDSAKLVIHAVVRRYVEPNRVVFVWRGLAEGQGKFDGLYTSETAWYVVRPSRGEHEGVGMVLESHTRLLPVGFDIASGTDKRGNEFVKVLTKADEGDVDDLLGKMKRLLLADQLHCGR